MGRLEPRSETILREIISEYMVTGEPVGSRTISKRLRRALSPASVRNIMTDLTDLGYIDQPHVSAGRVPTDIGIRFYVDSILKGGPAIFSGEQMFIESLFRDSGPDTRDVLRRSTSVLAGLSHQTGMVSTATAVEQTFKTIDFVNVSADKILVVLMSTSGFMVNKIIQDDDGLDQDTLERYSRMVNQMLKDLDLLQARERIEKELALEKTKMDAILAKILRLGHIVLTESAEREIFIEGQTNILDDPEFAQVEKLRAVLITFEEKSKLLTILEKTLAAEGVQILVGAEHGLEEISGCSIVAYPVRTENKVMGSIAVIGPKRMNYQKMVDLVYTTGNTLSRILRGVVEHTV